MFSIKQNIFQQSTRLPLKRTLSSMDFVYKGQPFINVVSKSQDTKNLDTVYKAQPYIGSK